MGSQLSVPRIVEGDVLTKPSIISSAQLPAPPMSSPGTMRERWLVLYSAKPAMKKMRERKRMIRAVIRETIDCGSIIDGDISSGLSDEHQIFSSSSNG